MKIVFPELAKANPIVRQAIAAFPNIEWLPAPSLDAAVTMVADHTADSMISGLDYSSRDVLLAYKAGLPLKSQFISSSFICERPATSITNVATNTATGHAATHLVLADGGVNKSPTKEQFLTIVEDSATTFEQYYHEQPRIALLSYSTYGSGGKNPDLEKFQYALTAIQQAHPNWLIDGEMQLDAAIDPTVAAKKTPNSPLQGQANVLITPDLNSGNLLYKSLERFGGFTIAGPLIQGFQIPLADLSRGSTVADVILTIKVLRSLLS